MDYQDGMEHTDGDMLKEVLAATAAFDPDAFGRANVSAALEKERLGPQDFAALLSPAADEALEALAKRAQAETRRYFGTNVSLFTPLYIANYCVNHCTYCGFSCTNRITRARLSVEEIAGELDAIAATGLDEVLLLTGESRTRSDVDFIASAVRLAAERFGAVGVEVYPLNTDEYALLHRCGADFVSVYQETYDPVRYAAVHPAGPKRSFPYRFAAQERALRGGMRGVGLGALLGLGDARRDAFAAGMHAYLLLRAYPHAELSFSVPRIRSFANCADAGPVGVGERMLLHVMLAYRLFMPFAGITVSTRERAGFRDQVAGLCATKMSAGVSVGVGGHEDEQKGDGQFDIADGRGVLEVHDMLVARGMQPVYTDYIRGE
jgi:2-iminoacetate synthase